MKAWKSVLPLSLVALALSCQGQPPSPAAPAVAEPAVTKSIQKDGLTLAWSVGNQDVDDTTIRLFTDEFFSAYPRLRARFNPRASDRVTIVVDPDYQGAARTEVSAVRYSAAFLAAHPKETGSLTHELAHVVQGYPGDRDEPSWLTEGIAEYARSLYATDDFARSGWKLPVVFASYRYTDSYRVTGRFLLWLDQHMGPAVIDGMDSSMRRGDYSAAVWTALTGKTVDELWRQYLGAADLRDGMRVTVLPAVVSQGCSLSVDETGGACTSVELQRISDLFFSLYPKVCRRFQVASPRPVKLLVNFDQPGDCRFDALEPGMIILSDVYLNKDQNALGALEYNLVCTALSYPSWGWLQTGLAVYCRYRYGTSDTVAGWPMPAYDAKQRLTDGFDVTARFLVWAEAKYGSRLIDGLDAALRAGSCTPSDWKALCGFAPDELWAQYAANPKVP